MGHDIEPGRAVLSSSEASTLSGLRRNHIDYLIRQGKLEAVKVGNTWLVYEDSLKRYLASPRKPGPKPRDLEQPPSDTSMPGAEG